MWETRFARIANALNNLPIAKGNNHSGLGTGNFDIITPNRLLLVRNNQRRLGGEGMDFESGANLQKLLAGSHKIFGTWYRLYIDNIHLLNMA